MNSTTVKMAILALRSRLRRVNGNLMTISPQGRFFWFSAFITRIIFLCPSLPNNQLRDLLQWHA
jgi:hypothetical protein